MSDHATPFACMALVPGGLGHAGLGVAAARAGATGLLDLAFCDPGDWPRAGRNLAALAAATAASGEVGLRFEARQARSVSPLLAELPRGGTLLVSGWADAPRWRELLGPPRDRPWRLLLEVASLEEAERLEPPAEAIDGIVARGSECGGWAGEASTFVLTQTLLERFASLPLYVRGAVGIGSTAACLRAGAAGVVFDDQLLLMAESPLPASWRSALERAGGRGSVLLGEALPHPCRVLKRPDSPAFTALESLARTAEAAAGEDGREGGAIDRWRAGAGELLGWGPPERRVWPVGEAVALAAPYRDRYRTLGRFLQALRREVADRLALAVRHPALTAGAPLAESHRTAYPIVQGPMTRVSDTPEFARAVAAAGALPMVALALMRRDRARTVLEATAELLAGRPWGVGILGFVPPELRREQIDEIRRVRPSCVVIAGGRPDQAAALEDEGIAVYLHAPTPELLRGFLERGARRFVLEGRECGGHVGPLGSLTLWELAVDALLEHCPDDGAPEVHVLFAGGVHDGRSASMVEALAAPLAARGMKVGVLMGTAYLFTREAVATGAVSRAYQERALACRRTVNLVSGPGHANRCAESPFVRQFYDERRRLLAEGADAGDLRARLERLQLGRLRLAAKGVLRGPGGSLEAADETVQQRDGMYMIGEVAAARSAVCDLRSLHAAVARDGERRREPAVAVPRPAPTYREHPSDVAIIGMSLLVPGASDLESFWRRLLERESAITEIPPERWDWRLYFDADRRAGDAIYSRWGGFCDDFEFDPLDYGIPPASLKHVSVAQIVALELTRRALRDAGYAPEDIDREHTATIVASADQGFLALQYYARSMLPLLATSLDRMRDRLPEWSEDSFPGLLENVVAGRVANRFDLGGPNFTVDSACASSLTALDLAVQELECGRSNLAIVGGIEMGQTPYQYTAFSKTHALSPDGEARVFGEGADGIVLGEGCAFAVLKRLDEAERDGDRVYAVVKAVAAASDGKGRSLTAPKSQGQTRVMARAYRKAGISPATLGLYEAHGTGTRLGDRTELDTVTGMLRAAGAGRHRCAVGSVKSLIGHTKSAAGLVSVVKTALALHHRTLPPHATLTRPLAVFAEDACPTYLLDRPAAWLCPGGRPRRAGVSGFGFGGTNVHTVLEEHTGRVVERAPGADAWPVELIAFRAESREALLREVRSLREALDAGAEPRLRDLAYSYAVRADERADAPRALALVAGDLADLRHQLAALEAREEPGGAAGGAGPAGGAVAFLFPGQGSQYPDMGREPALYFREFREAFEQADELLASRLDASLGRLCFPVTAVAAGDAERARAELSRTRTAQPAIGAVSAAYWRLARRLGLRASMLAGHSYGELTALFAAGCFDFRDLIELSAVRGGLMDEVPGPAGAMAALQASPDEVAGLLARVGAEVTVANYNGPRQVVVCGSRAAVAEVLERCGEAGVRGALLPVSAAFHSPAMGAVTGPFAAAVAERRVRPPEAPVYGTADAAPYDLDAEAVRAGLVRQIVEPVRFGQQVEAMVRDGARCFVEVGPGRVLTRLAGDVLGDRPAVRVALDGAEGGLRGLLRAVGELFVAGAGPRLSALHDDRDVDDLPLGRLVRHTSRRPPSPTAVRVNGLAVLSAGGRSISTREPLLTVESREREARSDRLPAAGAPAPAGAPSFAAPAPELPEGLGAAAGGDDGLIAAYQAYQETMRQFLRTQEAVLGQLLGTGLEPSGEAVLPVARAAPEAGDGTDPAGVADPRSAEPPPAGHAAPAAASAARGPAGEPSPGGAPEDRAAADAPARPRAELERLLVELISERTGYPPEAVGLDLHVEAELGIDSIKRLELIDAFGRMLPRAVRQALEGEMQTVAGLRTLREIVHLVVEMQETHEPAAADEPAADEPTVDGGGRAAPAPAVHPGGAGPPADEACPRYVVRWKRDPVLDVCLGRLYGLYLITDDAPATGDRPPGDGPDGPPGPIARELGARLRALGARGVIVPRRLCASREGLRELVDGARARHGPVRGVIHLAPLAAPPVPAELAGWRELTEVETKSLYRLIRACGDDLQDAARHDMGRVLAATMLGGYFGRHGSCGPGSPAGGGGHGFLKTQQLEWPSVLTKSIDFDHGRSPAEIARILEKELVLPGGGREIGYPRGERTTFWAAPAALPSDPPCAQPALAGDAVIVATGGGGIVARVLRRLARRGMTVYVVGRSALPDEDRSGDGDADDAPALRRRLVEEARAGGRRPVPARIEEEVQRILRGREVRRNLDALQRSGVAAVYSRCDVRDEAALSELIGEIYDRHGRIDAVLHGAGVIEDRSIRDKESDSFDRVFDTKADGAFLLYRLLRPGTLRLLVLFSSVAGRLGNHGQADYAAANEVLNRFAWRMSREWPATRVLSVNWGPWRGVGMASPSVSRHLEERGIQPIDPEAALRFIVDEIAGGSRDDVEVIAGEAPWEAAYHAFYDSFEFAV